MLPRNISCQKCLRSDKEDNPDSIYFFYFITKEKVVISTFRTYVVDLHRIGEVFLSRMDNLGLETNCFQEVNTADTILKVVNKALKSFTLTAQILSVVINIRKGFTAGVSADSPPVNKRDA